MRTDLQSRARGCLLGQLAGDSLGALVEFRHADDIKQQYPLGVRCMAYNDFWNILPGQPTDDSEMALLLARMLVEQQYAPDRALEQYRYWLRTEPFDCGMTICSALLGEMSPLSQANGALMRISPLGIAGVHHSLNQVAQWAMQDAALTHVHPICQQANALYAMALAHVIRSGDDARSLYAVTLSWAEMMGVDAALMDCLRRSACAPPDAAHYYDHMGWVLVAFGNAFYQLLHAPTLEEGVVDTIMRGGDTDTNAAICGALLGAVYGEGHIPPSWREALLTCRPREGAQGVRTPRPECFWPVDALELADRLIGE